MRQIDQKGIVFIPLFFIVPLVVVAVGVIGVRSGYFQGINTGIAKFLAAPSPSNLPQPLGMWQQEPTRSVSLTPTPKKGGTPQYGPYNFKPQGDQAKAGVPAFTISPPSGWNGYSASSTELARFESTQIDKEEVEGGEVTTNAIIGVRATDSYSGLADFISQYKASSSNAQGYRSISASTQKVSNQDGYRMEFTYQTQVGKAEITVHELNYLTFKNGISFLVKGYSSDSAWNNHSSEIRTTLNSFKFN